MTRGQAAPAVKVTAATVGPGEVYTAIPAHTVESSFAPIAEGCHSSCLPPAGQTPPALHSTLRETNPSNECERPIRAHFLAVRVMRVLRSRREPSESKGALPFMLDSCTRF